MVVVLRSLFLCWLSPGGCSQLLEAALIPWLVAPLPSSKTANDRQVLFHALNLSDLLLLDLFDLAFLPSAAVRVYFIIFGPTNYRFPFL